MPPAITQPGVSASTRVSAWPMRPAAPSTAIFMSLMGEDRSRHGREADGVVERRRIPLEATFYAASRPAHKPPSADPAGCRRFYAVGVACKRHRSASASSSSLILTLSTTHHSAVMMQASARAPKASGNTKVSTIVTA